MKKIVQKYFVHNTQDPLPTTYAGWKDKLIKIGHLQECFKSQFDSHSGFSSNTPNFCIPHTFVTNIHPSVKTKRPRHGVTPGAGTLMDINKLKCNVKCFNCNETGHFCHDCPHKRWKINICIMLEQLEDEEWNELSLELGIKDWTYMTFKIPYGLSFFLCQEKRWKTPTNTRLPKT